MNHLVLVSSDKSRTWSGSRKLGESFRTQDFQSAFLHHALALPSPDEILDLTIGQYNVKGREPHTHPLMTWFFGTFDTFQSILS
jgi:hypothetical protein